MDDAVPRVDVQDLRTCTVRSPQSGPARAGTPSSGFCLAVPAVRVLRPQPGLLPVAGRRQGAVPRVRRRRPCFPPQEGGMVGSWPWMPDCGGGDQGWTQAHRHRSARRPDRSHASLRVCGAHKVAGHGWRSSGARTEICAGACCSPRISCAAERTGRCRAATDPVRSRVPLPRVTHRVGALSLF